MRVGLLCISLVVVHLAISQSNDRFFELQSKLDTISREVPGLFGEVDFTLNNAPMHELLRAMAETHALNINIRRLPNVYITNNFNSVSVRDVLLFLCREYSLTIDFVNNILTIRPYEYREPRPIEINYAPRSSTISFNLRGDTLANVVKEITIKTGRNVLATPEVRDQLVTGFVSDLNFAEAMQKLAATNNLEVEGDPEGVTIFKQSELLMDEEALVGEQPTAVRQRRTNARRGSRRGAGNFNLSRVSDAEGTYLTLDAQQADVAAVINAAAKEFYVNYIVLEPPQGAIEGYFSRITFDKFLSFATESGNVTYGYKDGVYLIGTDQKTGLAEATVYRFKERSVEGIIDLVPNIYSGLQLSVINDLNAILIVGGERDALSLVEFLEQIDEPVLNVLIEVIVTEVNQGSILNTGIEAFLTDTVPPPTSGQVLGGVDLTLSSRSINRNLDRLGGSAVNLGRVTPQFYARIQALENTNDLNIRSTPKLSTVNGNEATLTIGQSEYFLIETQNITGGVNPIITTTPRYEKVEANLDIKITPFVSANEDITLGIEAEFSDFIDPTVEGAPPGNATRKFLSKIRIRNEEMIVLGGLEEARDVESGTGVPVLSRIPILKWFFSSRTEIEQSNRLIIFIKPTIVY
ncbi:MAG: type II and III secretion system protein [Bacteroidota bacterium]